MRRQRFLAALLTGVLVAGGCVASAQADDLSDRKAAAEQKKREAEEQLSEVTSALEDTDAAMAQAYLDLRAVEAQLPVAQAELALAVAEVERTQREADIIAQRLQSAEDEQVAVQARIAENESNAQAVQRGIAELARQTYRGDGQADGVSLIIGSQSAKDFIDQYAAAQTATRSQTRSLQQLEQAQAATRNSEVRLDAVREQIVVLKDEADRKVQEAAAAQESAQAKQAEVEQLIAAQASHVATIEARKAEEEARQAQIQASRDQVNAELAQIVKEQEAERQRQLAQKPPASSGGGGGNAGGGNSGGGSGAVGRGVLNYPTAVPHVTSPYGWRVHPLDGVRKLHAGTDLRAYCGTPILAAASGTVQWARTMYGFGNQVMLNHGVVNGSSLMTSYNHLTSFAVSSGQRVNQGDVVGYSGNTGTSTACHLHFEVYVNGATVDPMSML